MMKRLLLLLPVLALGAACSEHAANPVQPEPLISAGKGPGTGSDTSSAIPSVMQLSGRTLAVSVVQGVSDSLRFTALPNVGIRVMHNVLKNGQATQELVATTASDASGRYHVDNLPGGYYVVYATPASAGFLPTYSYVPLQTVATADIYIWPSH